MLHMEMIWLIKTKVIYLREGYESIILFNQCPLATLYVAKYFIYAVSSVLVMWQQLLSSKCEISIPFPWIWVFLVTWFASKI